MSRGRPPIFVGGTPLYLKALLRGIFAGPPADWEFRQRVTAEAAHHGPDWLHAQVLAVDPLAASRLHPRDTKRLVRVLEVFEKTGQPISQLQREFDVPRPADQCRVFVLDWPRDVLYQRINAASKRCSPPGWSMKFATCLQIAPAFMIRRAAPSPKNEAEEPSPARDAHPLSRTARQALGYREVIEHLAGGPSLAQTIELVQNRTRASPADS